MEFIRLGILYLHLIACCIAIGLVLTSDMGMIKQLLYGNPQQNVDVAHLSSLQKTVGGALIALWLTGLALVAVDVSAKGYEVFSNPKLQAKIAMVVLLTCNAFLLHSTVLPMLTKAGSLLKLSFNNLSLAIFAGAVSGVSWCYAVMLGVGRPLAWKYSVLKLLAAYPFLVAGGCISMLLLTAIAKSRMDDGERYVA